MVSESSPSIRNAGSVEKKPVPGIQYNIFPPMEVPEGLNDRHVLEFNVGPAINYSWFSNGRWTTSTVETGSVISLSSPGLRDKVKWSGELHLLRITVSNDALDLLLDTNGFRFTRLRNVNDPFMREIAMKLSSEPLDGFPRAQKIYSESLGVVVLIHSACQYPENNKKVFAPKGKLSSLQLRNVVEFTRSSLHRNIRLAELASCTNLSEYHFARIFRQTVGVSPYKFVMNMKIEYAKELIRSGKKSFSDVAYLLSFSDQAHFSHAFKKVTGYSPRSFISSAGV
jgi:AraC family transcriptional regulator